MFSERLLDHFQHPRNARDLPAPATTVEVSNPACGDILRLAARIESGVVADAGYKCRGCTASIAAGSALTELMVGCTRSDLMAIDAAAVEHAVGGLTAETRHAAVLCVDAVRALAGKLRAE